MIQKLTGILILHLLTVSLQDDDCGRVFRSPETAVNGQETQDAPWTVSIGYHDDQVTVIRDSNYTEIPNLG